MSRLPRHTAVAKAAAAVALVALYAPAVRRPFVSEDFLILGRLAELPFVEALHAHLTGPLLGITFVTFYRPVAGALLHLELLLWGASPTGFLVLHVLVHAANAVLAARLARRLWPETGAGGAVGAAWAVAAVFALHPYHVNTVLFVASFATLFSATFLLGSLLLFLHAPLRARARPSAARLAGAGALFLLALGSYEQAAVLPVLLLMADLLAPRGTDPERPPERSTAAVRRSFGRWGLHGVAFGLLALYLLVRRAALGQLVGGYRETASGLASIDPVERIPGEIARMVWPAAGPGTAGWLGWIAAAAAILVALAMARLSPGTLRPWLLGLGWAAVSLAPFGFPHVVPANGRYWYLASFGVGLAAAAAGAAVGAAARRAGLRAPGRGDPTAAAGWGAAVAAGLLAASYLPGVVRLVSTYERAGETAERIQERLVELHDRGHDEAFAEVPAFLVAPGGRRLAQVFHWGLSDAVEPPFVPHGPRTYRLPDRPAGTLRPLLEGTDGGPSGRAVVRWDDGRGELVPVATSAGARPRPVEIRRETRDGRPLLRFRALEGARHRLVLLTRINPVVLPAATGGEWSTAPLPWEVLRAAAELTPGPAYGWLEAVERGGNVVGTSGLIRLCPAAGPERAPGASRAGRAGWRWCAGRTHGRPGAASRYPPPAGSLRRPSAAGR